MLACPETLKGRRMMTPGGAGQHPRRMEDVMDDFGEAAGLALLLIAVMTAVYFPTVLRMIGGVCQ